MFASLAALLPLLAAPAVNPKFQFVAPPAKAEAAVDWKAQAKGGLIVTSGNSRSRSAVLGLTGARQSGADRLSVDGQLAYGRSDILVPVLDASNPAAPVLIGLDRQEETTTNQWQIEGRYDRYLSTNNLAYLLGRIGADEIAGKALVGGAQAGYSRQLWKSEHHLALAEIGYDLTFERYLEQSGRRPSPVSIHSARVFVGDELKLGAETGFTASVEALFNLNAEDALDARDETGMRSRVAAGKDTRINGKLALRTKVVENLSFAFGLTVKFDQNPAPRALPASAKGLPSARVFFADRVDTLTEATLIFTFL